jgi:hypothetical protein
MRTGVADLGIGTSRPCSSILDVLSSTATDLTKPFALAPPSQERVLKDSEQMIPRTRKSLEDAVLALQDLVVS